MDEATLNMLSNSGITDFNSIGSIDPNMMFSPGIAGIMGTVGTVINILSIIMYFGTAYGLYLINSKLGEKYAWLSFVPIAQYYNYFSASQKSVKNYLVYPILAIILGVILSMFTFGLTVIIAIIYFFVMWIKLLHAISLRTGNGAWTTLGFLFVSFIMFPIVGMKMEDKSQKDDIITDNGNPVLTNKSENEIEL